MSDTILDQFNTKCTAYIHSELNTRLLGSTSSTTCQYYFTEYQRCVDEQMNFVNYIKEQLASLEALKSCETTIDAFIERLKAVHEYEIKQNEIFEQILHELTKTNTPNKEERIRLLSQIDELIASKAKLSASMDDHHHSSTNKLAAKSSDTFKNIL